MSDITSYPVFTGELHHPELDRLRAEVEKLKSEQRLIVNERDQTFALMLARAESAEARNAPLVEALKPFAQMGQAMMGRKHHQEAVIQYALAPTIKVHHLTTAHAALAQSTAATVVKNT